MGEILELFNYTFIIRALIVGTAISLCAALIGILLVLKKYSMIGHGLGEIGFASLSLALAFNLPPLYVSIPMVVIASFLIMAFSQKKGASGDVVIAIVSTAALTFGVIITAITKGFNIDVYNYMFGSILAITSQDLILSLILFVIVVAAFIVYYNRLFLITYDEEYAKTTGINVTYYQFIISLATALIVVIGMRLMGTLLISSLIVFPAIISKKITTSFKGLVIVSGALSVLCFVIGIFVSFYMNLPAGASIVAVNIILLVITTIVNKVLKITE